MNLFCDNLLERLMNNESNMDIVYGYINKKHKNSYPYSAVLPLKKRKNNYILCLINIEFMPIFSSLR